jgi:hypothetical protein
MRGAVTGLRTIRELDGTLGWVERIELRGMAEVQAPGMPYIMYYYHYIFGQRGP